MKVKFNADRFIGVAAFVISVATLVSLMYQSNLVRKQNELIQKEQYASVMPYLTMGFMGSDKDDSFEMFLSNDGVGPAFIQSVVINYKDSVYDMSINEFYHDILKVDNPNKTKIMRTDIGSFTVLPANKKIPLLKVYANQEEAVRLLDAFTNMEASIEITYTSIYDQKWKLKNILELHIPVK